MNYRRNIIVYSESFNEPKKYDHGESRSMGQDLLVSYENKNHYNSVKRKAVGSYGDGLGGLGGGVERGSSME